MEWDDLSVGQVIEFRHRNRSQRLAGRTPAVRRGRIDLIWYPRDRETKKQLPQIRVRLMNRNGVIRYGRAGQHTLFDEYAIEDVVRVVKGRRQCVRCARSGGELSENGCPSCGPEVTIRWVPEQE
jgi:hypothetical protein